MAEEHFGEEILQTLLVSPFNSETWDRANSCGENICSRYWKNVLPLPEERLSPVEINEMIKRLLWVHRPRAAFSAICTYFGDLPDFSGIEVPSLEQLLYAVATDDSESENPAMPDYHSISLGLSALENLSENPAEKICQFELLFIEELRYSERGITNLENKISKTPEVFFRAVAFASEREDGKEDPPEWECEDPLGNPFPVPRQGEEPPEWRGKNPEDQMMLLVKCLLTQVKKIPGTDENGMIDSEALASWIDKFRQLCNENARVCFGDCCLGQLLAREPEVQNGIWPYARVYKEIEKIRTPGIKKGFCAGVIKSCDVIFVGVGTEKERQLAEKNRERSRLLHAAGYPYVADILEMVAEHYDLAAGR